MPTYLTTVKSLGSLSAYQFFKDGLIAILFIFNILLPTRDSSYDTIPQVSNESCYGFSLVCNAFSSADMKTFDVWF